jgi:PKD repeat protein
MFTCTDVTSGFPTTGFCVNSKPGLCRATATGGKDGFGLDQVAKILGDLMGKLMQQGGGQQPPATPPTSGFGDPLANQPPSCTLSASNTSSTASSTTATLTWSTTGTVNSSSIAPDIGAVAAFGSQSVTVPGTTAYTMTVNGPGGTNYCSTTVVGSGGTGTSNPCTGPFAALYSQCEDGGTPTTPTPTTTIPASTSTTATNPTGSIIASPQSGASPLTVVFSTYESGSAGAATIDFGDGSKETANQCPSSGGACTGPGQNTHTYTAAGTYTARLLRHTATAQANCTSGCIQIGSVSVVVSQGATTTPSVFANPAYLIPGLRGEIQIFSSGGTIIAGSRSQAGNTEVAGFFGSNTFNGQPQGVVANICRARPWANSVLSYVLPANFFDSLCVARGYAVGSPPPAQPTVTVTQTPQPKPTTPSVSTSTMPSVPAKVRIWSVPASVPLGSRASIFWTSQGVTSCLVTSPDGSFSQTTLSGGASTVALTGATTFTISCLAPDGTPVTDFTTVTISL